MGLSKIILTGDREFQVCFKKDYSTVGHMFTLLAIIQRKCSLNRELYVAFIDVEKAFDSISGKLLLPFLLKKKWYNGKLYGCFRSMYENVKARARCGAKFTEYINCTSGVKQGDVCSPVLFLFTLCLKKYIYIEYCRGTEAHKHNIHESVCMMYDACSRHLSGLLMTTRHTSQCLKWMH